MSNETIYLGCDPGESGGIAILEPESTTFIRWDQFTTRDAFIVLRGMGGQGAFALVEKVHAMPGQGVSSTFKFGQSYGKLRTLLICAGIPFDEVTPAQWQKEMQCRTKGDKNVSKRRAQELFPGIKITHRNADAYLLAELCRRRRAQLSPSGGTDIQPELVETTGEPPLSGDFGGGVAVRGKITLVVDSRDLREMLFEAFANQWTVPMFEGHWAPISVEQVRAVEEWTLEEVAEELDQ